MSLLIRINLALGAVFLAAALIAGYACRTLLEAKAQREVFAEAGLMIDSALAIRDYTANDIVPLLSWRIQNEFPTQSVPFHAATQNFLRLREPLIARYGGDYGFGWQPNEVVGAQVVSVPFASATANADRAFQGRSPNTW